MSGDPAVWVNGRREHDIAHAVSAVDRGFMLADGVFETLRVYGGAPFRLDAHLARMARGAAALGISVPASVSEQIHTALGDAAREGRTECALRVTLTRGVGGAPGLAPSPGGTPTLVITVHAAVGAPPSLMEHGLSAWVSRVRRNEHSPLAACKTLAFTESIAALIEAQSHGADDAIVLDTAGHISEGSASNVFMWSDDTLVTPPLSCGALPGVTRAAVIELATAARVPVDERMFEVDELVLAREAFFTSTLREIAPLVRLDGRAIGDGVPGPLTRRFAGDYAALARAATPPRR